VVEGDVGGGGGFPSFSLVSSVSLISPLLFFFHYLLFFSSVSSWLSAAVGDGSVSGGQVVCCGSGEEARWQLRLFFFFGIYFFLCHFPFSPLPPPNVPPLSVIFLFGHSLLPLLFFLFFLLCSPLFSFLPPPSFCCFGPFLFTPFSLENLLFLSFDLSFLSKKNCRSFSPGLSSPFSFFSPPPFFCAFLCIYRQLGRGLPYPVQVQGMGLRLIFLP